LWRLCLGNECEAEYGDLLETYRDSIYPSQGRLRADIWLLRQVAGCILRADSTMNLRNWILAALTSCVLTLLVSVIRYSDQSAPSDPHMVRNLVVICGGFLFYAYVAVCRTRARTDEDAQVLRMGTMWGLTIGAVNILSLIGGNLRIAPPILLALLALALSFIAGAHGAVRMGYVSGGMRVGFWSGLINGLMVFLSLAAFGYLLAFVHGIPGAEFPSGGHPYTEFEYQRINVFDALGGALVYLFGGCVISTATGIMGGCVGMLLERTGRIPNVPDGN
jgi:hypothetical protein